MQVYQEGRVSRPTAVFLHGPGDCFRRGRYWEAYGAVRRRHFEGVYHRRQGQAGQNTFSGVRVHPKRGGAQDRRGEEPKRWDKGTHESPCTSRPIDSFVPLQC